MEGKKEVICGQYEVFVEDILAIILKRGHVCTNHTGKEQISLHNKQKE